MLEKALAAFEDWLSSLPTYPQAKGPARGTIGSSLVLLDQLKADFNLDPAAHRTEGMAQLKGMGQSPLKTILKRYGEERLYLSEGGRTNRGAPGAIESLLSFLKGLSLDSLDVDSRNGVLTAFQDRLYVQVQAFFSGQRLKAEYDPSESTAKAISRLLEAARTDGKEGPVAQYLVGAKLQLRFPDVSIGNESYSTADRQLGRHGDYYVGTTAFHVTVAPQQGVMQRCLENIRQGLTVYLLIPNRVLEGTRQNAEEMAPGRISVQSIESFTAQNIDELSGFSKDNMAIEFLRLLETYNKRVDAVENDKSLLIEIPANLSILQDSLDEESLLTDGKAIYKSQR